MNNTCQLALRGVVVAGPYRQYHSQYCLHPRQKQTKSDAESAEIFGSAGLFPPHKQKVEEDEGKGDADEYEVASEVREGKDGLFVEDGNVLPGESD